MRCCTCLRVDLDDGYGRHGGCVCDIRDDDVVQTKTLKSHGSCASCENCGAWLPH